MALTLELRAAEPTKVFPNPNGDLNSLAGILLKLQDDIQNLGALPGGDRNYSDGLEGPKLTLDTRVRVAALAYTRHLVAINLKPDDEESRPISLFARAKQSKDDTEEARYLARAQQRAQYEVDMARLRHSNPMLAIALLEQGYIQEESGNHLPAAQSYQEAGPVLGKAISEKLRDPEFPTEGADFLTVVRYTAMADRAACEYLAGDEEALKRYQDEAGYPLHLAAKLPTERNRFLFYVRSYLRTGALHERRDPTKAQVLRMQAEDWLYARPDFTNLILKWPDIYFTEDNFRQADIFGDAET